MALNPEDIQTFRNSVDKLSRCSHRMMNAACLHAEIEAMKAENAEREAQGKAPAHGFKQFMNTMKRWQYDG